MERTKKRKQADASRSEQSHSNHWCFVPCCHIIHLPSFCCCCCCCGRVFCLFACLFHCLLSIVVAMTSIGEMLDQLSVACGCVGVCVGLCVDESTSNTHAMISTHQPFVFRSHWRDSSRHGCKPRRDCHSHLPRSHRARHHHCRHLQQGRHPVRSDPTCLLPFPNTQTRVLFCVPPSLLTLCPGALAFVCLCFSV